MPRIPLYNQGMGSAVQLAAERLSPRADVGAFTAPGRALASAAEQIGDVAFRFGQEEKKRETRRVSEQLKNEIDTEMLEFNLNDQSLSTEEYMGKVGSIQKKYYDRIDGLNVTPSQREAIKSIANNNLNTSFVNGKIKAFQRGQAVYAKELNTTYTNSIDKAVAFPQLQDEIFADIQQRFNDADSSGLVAAGLIKWTPEDFKNSVRDQGFARDVDSASSSVQLDALRVNVEQSGATLKQKLALFNAIDLKRTDISNRTFEQLDETLGEYEPTRGEAKQIIDALEKRQNATVTLDSGAVVPILSSDMKGSDIRRSIALLESIQKETDDALLNSTSNWIATTADATTEIGPLVTSAENEILKSDADSLPIVLDGILSGSKSILVDAKVAYEAGDYVLAEQKVEQAQALLENELAGQYSLVNLGTSTGASARSAMESSVSLMVNINKDKKEAAFLQRGKDALGNGTFENVQSQYTQPEINKMVDEAIAGKPLQEQLAIAENNNVVIQDLKNIIEAGAGDILGASQDFEELSDTVELYKQTKARGTKVVNNHVTNETDRAVYESILALESTGKDRVEAIRIVNQAFKSGIDINPRYDIIKPEIDTIINQNVSSWIFFSTGEKVTNRSYVHEKMETLTKLYMRLGKSGSDAAEMARKQISESHMSLRGMIIPIDRNFPPDLPLLAELAAEDIYNRNERDFKLADIELEDISIFPTPGRTDEYNVVVNGVPYPFLTDEVIDGVSQYKVAYTLDELNGLLDAMNELDKQERISKINRHKRMIDAVEVQFPPEVAFP